MTRQIVDALRSTAKDFKASTWAQPGDLAFHRDQIALAVLDGSVEYRQEFVYPEFNVEGYVEAIRAIDDMVGDLPGILLEPIRHHLDSCIVRARALASGQDHRYETAAVVLDGLPEQNLVADAQHILAERVPSPVHSGGSLTAGELASRFETALNNYALSGWSVQVSTDMSARMSVNGPLRRIRIRSDASFSPAVADRLLVHEIGGHVLRWENAARQPEALALLALGSTVPTEEGLALWAESTAGLMDPYALRTYAARCIAVDMARTSGIVQIAAALHQHIELPAAVDIAIRVKRGLRDPNNTGGMTKDWGYFGGITMIGRLADVDPVGLQILCGVKWSAEHVPLAKELYAYGRLRVPELSSDDAMLGITKAASTATRSIGQGRTA